MGILRTDKISGLETPTAVTGSVVFDGSDYLAVTPTDQFEFGGTDFTIEMWVNITSISGMVVSTFFSKGNNGSSSTEFMSLQTTGNNTIPAFFFRSGSALVSGSSLELSKWYHLAVTRSGNTFRLFVDGKLVDSATNSDDLATGVTGGVSVGAQSIDLTANNRKFIGSLSNVRILKGTALYTSDFTPPTHALEVIGDTVLLCCNNPDSVGADGTGKTITASGDPTVSTDNPSLTRDFTSGTEFQGVTVFDTQGYFVPPSGTTTERYVNVATQASSSARGVFMGGLSSAPSGSVQDVMDYVTVTSTGNAADFGNLTAATRISSSCSSTTRGVRMGGFSDPATVDVIDYITIASTGNAQDFGNLSSAKHSIGGSANSTRGLSFGSSGLTNAIQFITISTTGDAQDFGDMVDGLGQVTGTASPTRCVMAGGEAPTKINTMQYVTIMSMGNAFDFGDLTIARSGVVSLSSATRGLYLGGELPASPNFTNTVDFVQIATTGNAINFGDLDNSNGMRLGATAASPTRGLYAGGGNDQPVSNTAFTKIHLFTIASTGNATDFGDITVARFQMNNGTVSSGHGGLG